MAMHAPCTRRGLLASFALYDFAWNGFPSWSTAGYLPVSNAHAPSDHLEDAIKGTLALAPTSADSVLVEGTYPQLAPEHAI